MKIDDILDAFSYLDDWEERYRYVIELGREMPPFPEMQRTKANKVDGCASQVWLATHVEQPAAADPILTFEGDSDAHLVKGLVALILALYSGRSATEIEKVDAAAILDQLGLREHLTPQRSNGVRAMVERIRREASQARQTAIAD